MVSAADEGMFIGLGYYRSKHFPDLIYIRGSEDF